MTSLDIDASDDRYDEEPHKRRRRRTDRPIKAINWSAIGVVVAIAVALLSLVGSGFSDYRRVNDRVLTLENLRGEDNKRMERIESKLDRLLERRQ